MLWIVKTEELVWWRLRFIVRQLMGGDKRDFFHAYCRRLNLREQALKAKECQGWLHWGRKNLLQAPGTNCLSLFSLIDWSNHKLHEQSLFFVWFHHYLHRFVQKPSEKTGNAYYNFPAPKVVYSHGFIWLWVQIEILILLHIQKTSNLPFACKLELLLLWQLTNQPIIRPVVSVRQKNSFKSLKVYCISSQREIMEETTWFGVKKQSIFCHKTSISCLSHH